MGIKQMNRDGFCQPELRVTDYGAQYVTAAKETKKPDAPIVVSGEKEGVAVAVSEPVVVKEQEVVAAGKEKKVNSVAVVGKPRSGRPKKVK